MSNPTAMSPGEKKLLAQKKKEEEEEARRKEAAAEAAAAQKGKNKKNKSKSKSKKNEQEPVSIKRKQDDFEKDNETKNKSKDWSSNDGAKKGFSSYSSSPSNKFETKSKSKQAAKKEKKYKQTHLPQSEVMTEFDKCCSNKWKQSAKRKAVEIITKDLFEMDEKYALAHCVSEDMRMGSGIATTFKDKFKKTGELLDQQIKTGGVAFIKHKDERYIYYLVTKGWYNSKPTNKTLFSSLYRLRELLKEHNVKKIAMPQIGCGLDRLEWEEVEDMLEYLFHDTDIEITICVLEESTREEKQKTLRQCPRKEVQKSVVNIEPETLIIYLHPAEMSGLTKEMQELEDKFSITKNYPTYLNVGDTITTISNAKKYILCGLVVKETMEDCINYEALEKCLQEVNRVIKNHKFYFIGIQYFEDEYDRNLTMNKILSLMVFMFKDVEIYVCYPDKYSHLLKPKEFNSNY